MPRRSQMLIAATFVVVAFSIHSHRALSGEKHRRTICCQPAVTCQPIVSQTAGLVPTCCQPVATSVSSSSTASTIELCAHAQPVPRRLIPQPDTLDIQPTAATTYCAQYMVANFGTYQLYYGINCANGGGVAMSGNNLGPLPGNCSQPNGACVTFGSSFVPTASGLNGLQRSNTYAQKGIKLARKRKAGEEPINQANPQATKPHELKERTRIGQSVFVKFPRLPGSGDFVVAELQRFSVKGVGANGNELLGTMAAGVEIDQAPAGKTVKELGRDQVTVTDDHVARVEIGNVTYDVVTASKLKP